jgi:effector-binding domain-containing protein
MVRIGDFSRLGRISVKALRYYDDIGLLKPVRVDQYTGYRYYSADQLPRLGFINALKEMGLSLEEVATLISNSLTPAQMRDLLILKKGEIRQQLSEGQKRLENVEALLKQIEKEGTVPDYSVVIRKIEPQVVASVRGVLPHYGEVGQFYGEIFKHLARKLVFKPSGPPMLICYDMEYKDRDVDVEVAVPIKKMVAGSDRVKVYALPALEQAACTIHKGSYEKVGEAYSAIMAWMEKNGYQGDGPDREVYLSGPNDSKDPGQYVTEIQFPVKKAG